MNRYSALTTALATVLQILKFLAILSPGGELVIVCGGSYLALAFAYVCLTLRNTDQTTRATESRRTRYEFLSLAAAFATAFFPHGWRDLPLSQSVLFGMLAIYPSAPREISSIIKPAGEVKANSHGPK